MERRNVGNFSTARSRVLPLAQGCWDMVAICSIIASPTDNTLRQPGSRVPSVGPYGPLVSNLSSHHSSLFFSLVFKVLCVKTFCHSSSSRVSSSSCEKRKCRQTRRRRCSCVPMPARKCHRWPVGTPPSCRTGACSTNFSVLSTASSPARTTLRTGAKRSSSLTCAVLSPHGCSRYCQLVSSLVGTVL